MQTWLPSFCISISTLVYIFTYSNSRPTQFILKKKSSNSALEFGPKPEKTQILGTIQAYLTMWKSSQVGHSCPIKMAISELLNVIICAHSFFGPNSTVEFEESFFQKNRAVLLNRPRQNTRGMLGWLWFSSWLLISDETHTEPSYRNENFP